MASVGGATTLILGERRGTDRDVRAGIEELDGRASVAARPVERNAKETHRRTASLTAKLIGILESSVRGLEPVLGLERLQVPHEVDVALALDVDERSDERVVGVETAREDDR
jgi:hypothetical protein